LANHRADQLSGGESQRVAIARALMQRPKIMMADEPVASLDPRVAEEVMSLFLDLIHKEGLTLLFTSHDLEQALKYSDRVLGLKNGHIEIDERSSLLNKDTLQEMYD
jgi:phosphonate transport system ATP-binding protein